MTISQWLKANIPVLLSPRFWGVVITATLVWVRAEGWIDELTSTWLVTIAGATTGIGVVDKIVDKMQK